MKNFFKIILTAAITFLIISTCIYIVARKNILATVNQIVEQNQPVFIIGDSHAKTLTKEYIKNSQNTATGALTLAMVYDELLFFEKHNYHPKKVVIALGPQNFTEVNDHKMEHYAWKSKFTLYDAVFNYDTDYFTLVIQALKNPKLILTTNFDFGGETSHSENLICSDDIKGKLDQTIQKHFYGPWDYSHVSGISKTQLKALNDIANHLKEENVEFEIHFLPVYETYFNQIPDSARAFYTSFYEENIKKENVYGILYWPECNLFRDFDHLHKDGVRKYFNDINYPSN